MPSPKDTGRIVAALMITQVVIGPAVNFGLLPPVFAPPGFLSNAAVHATRVRLSALLWLVVAAVTLAIGLTVWSLVRRYSAVMALWLVALSVLGAGTLIAESVAMMNMVSLSQEYAASGDERLRAVAVLARSIRSWAHYANLMVAGAILLALYGFLLRYPLVPRAVAALGSVGAVLHLTAMIMPFLGQRALLWLIAPLGVSQLLLIGILVARGFRDVPAPGANPADAGS